MIEGVQISIKFTVLDNGDLKITASNDARAELAYMAATGREYWSIMADAFENESCNGSYTHFDAGDANPFVGLSSAPCVAESMSTENDGKNVIDGRCWYFDQYQIVNDLAELKNKGRVVYTLAN